MFRDRLEAGKLLAEKLSEHRGKNAVVLAVPRGGVPVGYVVAKSLNLPLDLVLTKKIGHPFNKEYAIGAVSLTDSFVEPHPDVTPEYIDSEIIAVRKRLMAMSQKFMGGRAAVELKNMTVIVVDDGIATGNTLLATIHMIRKQQPKKIIIAVPVSPPAAVIKLEKVADEVIALIVTDDFGGVGAFYENFEQVSDEEVMDYLAKYTKEKQ